MGVRRKSLEQLQLVGSIERNAKRYKDFTPTPQDFVVSGIHLSCPSRYSKKTQRAWNSVVPQLISIHALTEQDLPSLELLFDSYDNLWAYDKLLKETMERLKGEEFSDLQSQLNFYARMKRDAMDNYMKLSSRFGISPTERTRLNTIDVKEDDPLDAILNG